MAKRVFFSFHYQDVKDFRANVVRQHWVTKPDREEAGFFDASIWEKAQTEGEAALKRLINGGVDNTSVTCVLIGSETYSRPWVRYEILKSFQRGNHLLAVHINSINGRDSKTKPPGPNPLQHVGVNYSADGKTATLLEWNGASWAKYTRIGGTAEYGVNVGDEWRGKGFSLDNLYHCYDWVADDGYGNFATWVG
jgi:hypothetical protein